MTMHSTVLRERGLIWNRVFSSRASAIAVGLALWSVAMLFVGMWIEGRTQKAALSAADTCSQCGKPLAGEVTSCHTACLKAVVKRAGDHSNAEQRARFAGLVGQPPGSPMRSSRVNQDTGH